jgi:predicted secreted hydrolase
MRRAAIFFIVAIAALAASAATYDPVVPGRTLEFPRDFGAHPGHRVEWWYVTGQLDGAGRSIGFQVTFFRLRNPEAESNPSRFKPAQLLFAHAAIGDPVRGRLLHDERVARSLAPLAEAREDDTDVRIDDWSLRREGRQYRAHIPADGFSLELTFAPTQPVMLQGERGFSRKGPTPAAASYYYSEPHLRVAGRLTVEGKPIEVYGTAWLDHEWSSELLVAGATGWDWIGVNLDDGGALMAFRIRGKDGAAVWSGATYRSPRGEQRSLPPAAVRFSPARSWRSPRTGTLYPVAMTIEIEGRAWRVEPLMDDQELDARASTGTLYWEGAVRVTGPGGERGRGYLELTGYGQPLAF